MANECGICKKEGSYHHDGWEGQPKFWLCGDCFGTLVYDEKTAVTPDELSHMITGEKSHRGQALKLLPETEENMVKLLGSRIGYGRIMQLCEKLWHESLVKKGYSTGGEHTTGPAATFMVPCGCKDGMCDWCCGSGRLTKHVKELKDAMKA